MPTSNPSPQWSIPPNNLYTQRPMPPNNLHSAAYATQQSISQRPMPTYKPPTQWPMPPNNLYIPTVSTNPPSHVVWLLHLEGIIYFNWSLMKYRDGTVVIFSETHSIFTFDASLFHDTVSRKINLHQKVRFLQRHPVCSLLNSSETIFTFVTSWFCDTISTYHSVSRKINFHQKVILCKQRHIDSWQDLQLVLFQWILHKVYFLTEHCRYL